MENIWLLKDAINEVILEMVSAIYIIHKDPYSGFSYKTIYGNIEHPTENWSEHRNEQLCSQMRKLK